MEAVKIAGGGGTSTGVDFSGAGARRAEALHQSFGRLGYHLLAGRVRLEFAAEQQSGQHWRLVGQQQSDNLQRHKLSQSHTSNGKPLLPTKSVTNARFESVN
jgi:hypothetical protein